jgi:TPP-dependent pyruvate/acetoin dehydrogenase alpha subunit
MKAMIDLSLSLELFREMLRIRLIEEVIAHRYHEQNMRCPVHLSIGQEGIAVGVCKAIRPTDYLVSNHRAHAHYLAKGGNLRAMIAEIYGKSTGCCLGRGGSMHLVDLSVSMLGSTPIVGGSIPIGVGLAFATQMKRESHVTVIFLGEGATEEGVFTECLNFAALKKLPVLFVCENNFYSVYSPLHVRQPLERDRTLIARDYGLMAQKGDGNDVEEVYEMTRGAVQSIRAGEGPYFLEFDTYRHREHCGPNFDNHIGYREEDEFMLWEKKCPLQLQAKRIPLDVEELKGPILEEIREAFAFAEQSDFPHFTERSETPYA